MSWIDDRVSNAKKQVEITATPKMEEEVETNTWPAWQEYGKGGGGRRRGVGSNERFTNQSIAFMPL